MNAFKVTYLIKQKFITMSKIFKITLFWIVAFLITATAAVYQRITGPTHPKKVVLIADNQEYNFKLTRSHEGADDCPVVIEVPNKNIIAKISYRRYPTNEKWKTDTMLRDGNLFKASVPGQPAAGKVEYRINFFENGKLLNHPEDYHTIVRFKGIVPNWVLATHIPAMFIAMLLANFAAIMALARRPKAKIYAWLSFAFLFVGGIILGPILQFYAFGDLWTGVPFGWDLTDNKTLIAFVTWVVALYMNRNETKYGWIIGAAVMMLIVFSIPHSMFGSEFDYVNGTVTQG